jgi:hypothetical protein
VEFESATQKVLLLVETMCRMLKNFNMRAFFARKQFYFVIFSLKITGHGNPDNNLETHCTSTGIIFRNFACGRYFHL